MDKTFALFSVFILMITCSCNNNQEDAQVKKQAIQNDSNVVSSVQLKTIIFFGNGLRGIPLTETKKNLQTIIDKVKSKYPQAKIVLAGMQIPPNMGQQYSEQFKKIYPSLAANNNIKIIPFLLEGVGGDPKLNQQDGIHPTAAGDKIVAENVWKVLKGILNNSFSK